MREAKEKTEERGTRWGGGDMEKKHEATHRWTLVATRNWERKGRILLTEPLERGRTYHQLDFRPLAPRPMKEERDMESRERYGATRGDEVQKVSRLSPQKVPW